MERSDKVYGILDDIYFLSFSEKASLIDGLFEDEDILELIKKKEKEITVINEMHFQPEPILKLELAQAYFGDKNPHSSLRRLKRRIDNNAPLRQALETIGYTNSKHSHTFTAREVRLITQYLGLPGALLTEKDC